MLHLTTLCSLLLAQLDGTNSAVSVSNESSTKKPHFVMLFVDDLGYGDLGFTGHPSTLTPNLDRLASLGMRLTNWCTYLLQVPRLQLPFRQCLELTHDFVFADTGYPVCSASRAALLTGRQPPRIGKSSGSWDCHGYTIDAQHSGIFNPGALAHTGMPGVINSLSAAGLPLNETTVADHLRGAGYKTLAIGKVSFVPWSLGNWFHPFWFDYSARHSRRK